MIIDRGPGFYRIKIPDDYEIMEKSKMTREEAIDKVRLKRTAVNPADLIDTLEALGLLKFDERSTLDLQIEVAVKKYTVGAMSIDVLTEHLKTIIKGS
jgi:hypothetical protein